MLSTLKGKKRTRPTLTNYFAKKSKIQMKTPTLKIVINQIQIVKRLVVAVRRIYPPRMNHKKAAIICFLESNVNLRGTLSF